MIPTALADNCLLVEHALKGLLAKTNSHQFIWSARTAPDLLQALDRKRPRILIVDPSISGHPTGLQLVQKLSTQYPGVRLLIYSAGPDQDTAANYMFLGGAGFLPKDSSPQEVLTAIQCVSAGQHYMPPGLTRALAELQIAGARAKGAASARQQQVWEGLAKGQPLAVIAQNIGCSPKTASTHRARLLEKLGLHSNAELARNFQNGRASKPAAKSKRPRLRSAA
jgi:DNA-binding NarL/FixJ family response regulator